MTLTFTSSTDPEWGKAASGGLPNVRSFTPFVILDLAQARRILDGGLMNSCLGPIELGQSIILIAESKFGLGQRRREIYSRRNVRIYAN